MSKQCSCRREKKGEEKRNKGRRRLKGKTREDKSKLTNWSQGHMVKKLLMMFLRMMSLMRKKLSVKKLESIKLLPRFHVKAIKYLIDINVMDDVEQAKRLLEKKRILSINQGAPWY